MNIPQDLFLDCDPGPFVCELSPGRPGDNGAAQTVRDRICAIGLDGLRARATAAENELMSLGVTFTVYSTPTPSIEFFRSIVSPGS